MVKMVKVHGKIPGCGWTLTGVGRVIERVAGHQGAAVQAAGEDELDLGRPLLDGVRLRLPAFVVLLEIVREIAV